MSQEQQIQALKKALEAQKNIQAIQMENDQIRQKIDRRQDDFERLSKLTLSAASLLNSVDSSAKETEISSVKCLSKIEESSAVTGEEKEEDDQVKQVVGKYLNELLVTLAGFASANENTVDIFTMEKIEEALNQLFKFAEVKQIVPPTKDGEGWKTSLASHQAIFAKIHEIMGQKEE